MCAVNNTPPYIYKCAQSCPTLCNPMDCSPPGSLVHGDSPGRNTGVDSSSSRRCLPPGNLPDPGTEPAPLMFPVLAGRFFTTSATGEVPLARSQILLWEETGRMEAQDLWALFPLTPSGLLLWLEKGSASQTQPPSHRRGGVPCSGGTEAPMFFQDRQGGFALGGA